MHDLGEPEVQTPVCEVMTSEYDICICICDLSMAQKIGLYDYDIENALYKHKQIFTQKTKSIKLFQMILIEFFSLRQTLPLPTYNL